MSIFTLVYLSFLPWMDSISVCIWSHFYSDSVFSSIRVQIAACFGVPLCSCQLFSKHLSIICFRFRPFQSLLLFYCSTSVHLIDCSCRQIHSLLLKAHFFFFILAISLLFKSMDNVVLSILQPFHWRVQGFTLSLPPSPLSFLRASWGVGGLSVVLLLKRNCLSVMNHDVR